MKPISPKLLVAGLLLAACASQPGPYSILKFWPITTCDVITPPGDNVYIGAGTLDVGPGAPISYVVGTTITGTITQPGSAVGDTTLEYPNRNHGVVKQVVITYKLSRSLGTAPKPYIVPQTIPLTGTTAAAVELISPELADLLINGLSATPDLSDTVDVIATIEFRGEYSADNHTFTTGAQDFPIHVYKSGDGCGVPAADAGVPSLGCLYFGQQYLPACP